MKPAHIWYRLYRQRRLLALCYGVILAGVVLAQWSQGALVAGGAVALLLTVVLVTLPASHIEVMAMAFTTGLMLACKPWVEWLLTLPDPDRVARVMPLVILLVVLIWIFLSMLLIYLIAMLESFPVGEKRYRYRGRIPLPLEQAVEALVMRPGQRMTKRVCGTEDADGLFRVTLQVRSVDPQSFDVMEQEISYHARTLEEDAGSDHLRVTTQTIFGPRDNPTTSVTVQDLQRDGADTIYACEEVHDHFSALAWITFWLRDSGVDHLRTELDGYLGRPSPTVAFGSQIGLVGHIGRGFRAMGLIKARPDGYPPF